MLKRAVLALPALIYVSFFINGHILHELTGKNGFGYDPLFYVDELHCAMAELSSDQKNAVSHRGRALEDFMRHFNEWWQA